MSMESDAKETAILKLLSGFPSTRVTDDMIDAYLSAAETVSAEAVEKAAMEFLRGEVPDYNTAYAPSSGQLVARASIWDKAIAYRDSTKELEKLVAYPIGAKPPPPLVPLGPTKVDLGNGEIDLTGKSHREKEAILRGETPTEPESVRPKLRRMDE